MHLKKTFFVLKPRFCEIDKHSHVHNGVYFSYGEEAVRDYLDQNQLLTHYYHNDELDPLFYVHSVNIRYISPIRFNDTIKIEVSISDFTDAGIKFVATVLSNCSDQVQHAKIEIIWVSINKQNASKRNHSKEFNQILEKLKI